MEPSKKSLSDPQTMIDAFANRNQPPKLVDEHPPVFPKDFDWSESARAWKAVPEVVRHAEQCWPELVKHLNDERYCATLETFSGGIHNYPVGEICREIIARNLAAAYYQNLRPESMAVYARLGRPEIADDKKKLKAWCEERSKKKLYELQIEMCQWAITELEKNDIPRVSRLRKRAWIASIEAEIESLRESKCALPFFGFGTEELVPYHPGKAEEVR